MTSKFLAAMAAFTGLACVAAPPAHAVPVNGDFAIRVTDARTASGASAVTVTSQDYDAASGIGNARTADTNTGRNSIGFTQNFGTIQLGAALARESGTPYLPNISFGADIANNTLRTSASNDQGITILLTQRNLTTNGLVTFSANASTAFPANLAGTDTAKVVVEYFINTDNSLFGLGTLLGSITLQQSGDSAARHVAGDFLSAPQLVSGPYSITERITITGLDYNRALLGFGSNIQVATVPEPMSMAFLGTGLIALGLVRRRRFTPPVT